VEGYFMRAVVIGNAPGARPPARAEVLAAGDLIVAVDGGARLCLELGLAPQLVVGDLDSLAAEDLSALTGLGAELIRHPVEKDHTDLDLALAECLVRGADTAVVFGALGGRWDQTLANVGLAAAAHLDGLAVTLVEGSQALRTLAGGESLTLHGRPGDTLSLVPFGADAEGVRTEGLYYPLSGENLPLGSTRGVSNVFPAPRPPCRCSAAGWPACTWRSGKRTQEESEQW
jgi:thiamine pyrophosphokinase